MARVGSSRGQSHNDEDLQARRLQAMRQGQTRAMTSPLADEIADSYTRLARLRHCEFARPEKTRVMVVANQKGGVGKTSTVVNLAAAMASKGLNVLVIDNDPQGNCSTALGIDHAPGTPSIYDVMSQQMTISEVVQVNSTYNNLLVVPASIDLAGAEIELVTAMRREYRLRDAIEQYLSENTELDYVFIDCPPSLGLLTLNAFVGGDEVLIPIQAEYYALEGLSQLLNSVERIRVALHPGLRVSTILMTMYDKRTNLSREVLAEVQAHFPKQTLQTVIPRSVKISEAPSFGQTVVEYEPRSPGAISYLEAAYEITTRA